jgi:hypothetical protein
VISGEGQYRRWIIAVWLVELIIIILRLAEIVDDVAQMEKELSAASSSKSAIILSGTSD